MADVTALVNFDYPLPGFACGTASAADTNTLNTGLGTANIVFIANATNDDCVINVTSTTAGIVTLSMKEAGSAASAQTIYWMAWRKPN